jgi:hypothetical protein
MLFVIQQVDERQDAQVGVDFEGSVRPLVCQSVLLDGFWQQQQHSNTNNMHQKDS